MTSGSRQPYVLFNIACAARAVSSARRGRVPRQISTLIQDSLFSKGEALGVASTREVTALYPQFRSAEPLWFVRLLKDIFRSGRGHLQELRARRAAGPNQQLEPTLGSAFDPLRRELIRKLKRAQGNITGLVARRGNRLRACEARRDLLHDGGIDRGAPVAGPGRRQIAPAPSC